jgi:hypothetical protein
MKEALIENLTLLSEINIRLTDLLLMYNYIISINRILVEGVKLEGRNLKPVAGRSKLITY